MLMTWALSPAILLHVKLAISAPLNYFPVNSQLPPVARISEPFSFVFSPLTFTSLYPISYSLIQPPGWLSLDSGSRTLYGTPTEQYVAPGTVVGVPVNIEASDQEGSTIVTVTLVVSRNLPPQVVIPLSDQISKFGSYSAPSTIMLNPSKEFSFAFDLNTFSPSASSYYAVTGDNAPLPSWISFNADSMSFSGRTPSLESLLQPPQIFITQLVASDVAGFASVSVPFSIIVGGHELTVDTPHVDLNATPGIPFTYDNLQNILKLDNKLLDHSNVTSILTEGLPKWLEFDATTWILRGTPDPSANSTSITLTVIDVYNDRLNVTLAIGIEEVIFLSDLPAVNASAGTDFTFDLKPYLRDPANVDIRVTEPPQVSWIQFDPLKLEFLGTVPVTATTSTLEITLEAKSKSSQLVESHNLTIQITVGSTTTSTSLGSTHSGTLIVTSATTSTASATPDSPSPEYSPLRIVLAVLIPLILLSIIAIVVVLCCCCRRRRRDHHDEHMPEVSAPIPGTFVKHEASSLEGGPLGTRSEVGNVSSKKRSRSGNLPAAAVYRRRSSSNPSLHSSNSQPHAMTSYALGHRRPLSDSAVRETRESWLAGNNSGQRQSPGTDSTDGTSFLSGATFGTDDHNIQGATPALVIGGTRAQSFRRPVVTSPVPGLSVPVFNEPSSIQVTPEFAYIAGGNSSDEGTDSRSPTNPDPTSAGAADLGHQRMEPSDSRTASTRVSKAWRGGSPSRLLEEYKRKTNMSTSTVQTTRTSILMVEAPENPAVTSTLTRPTVVHISSRPCETRNSGQRVDGSTALFMSGSTSTIKSPNNSGVETISEPKSPMEELPTPLSVPYDTTVACDGDSSLDRAARNMLGIAYRDMIRSGRQSVKSIITARRSLSLLRRASGEGRKGSDEISRPDDRESTDFMSPAQWPRPKTTEGRLPQISSVTALTTPENEEAEDAAAERPRSKGSSGSPAKRRPPVSMKHRREASREERICISRMKEQHALDDFKAMISKPDPAWPHSSPRPFPETPVRATSSPLIDRPDGFDSGRLDHRNKDSHKPNNSVKTLMSKYDGTGDVSEDIRPESAAGAESSRSSTGRLPAFI